MDFKTLIEVVSVCCDVIELFRKLSKLMSKIKERKAKKKYRPKLPKR